MSAFTHVDRNKCPFTVAVDGMGGGNRCMKDGHQKAVRSTVFVVDARPNPEPSMRTFKCVEYSKTFTLSACVFLKCTLNTTGRFKYTEFSPSLCIQNDHLNGLTPLSTRDGLFLSTARRIAMDQSIRKKRMRLK